MTNSLLVHLHIFYKLPHFSCSATVFLEIPLSISWFLDNSAKYVLYPLCLSLSTVVINYFPKFLPGECGNVQWEGAIWEGVEENVCSQTLLILYLSSCLEFLGGWWLSRWCPCWCFDVTAYCPCIVRETSRIVTHMQSFDHWGEIQTLHVFLSNFALSHMVFPLDTTSVHSLTTTAVRPMYWSSFPECRIRPEDGILQCSFELSNIFTY